jgi:hypothetical protein
VPSSVLGDFLCVKKNPFPHWFCVICWSFINSISHHVSSNKSRLDTSLGVYARLRSFEWLPGSWRSTVVCHGEKVWRSTVVWQCLFFWIVLIDGSALQDIDNEVPIAPREWGLGGWWWRNWDLFICFSTIEVFSAGFLGLCEADWWEILKFLLFDRTHNVDFLQLFFTHHDAVEPPNSRWRLWQGWCWAGPTIDELAICSISTRKHDLTANRRNYVETSKDNNSFDVSMKHIRQWGYWYDWLFYLEANSSEIRTTCCLRWTNATWVHWAWSSLVVPSAKSRDLFIFDAVLRYGEFCIFWGNHWFSKLVSGQKGW